MVEITPAAATVVVDYSIMKSELSSLQKELAIAWQDARLWLKNADVASSMKGENVDQIKVTGDACFARIREIESRIRKLRDQG